MQFFQAEDQSAGRMNGCTYEYAPDYPTLLKWQAKYPNAPRLKVTKAELLSGVYGREIGAANPAPPLPGQGVTEEQVHEIVRDELGAAQIVPGTDLVI